ncbi:MAG TPA: two-component system response regulator [Bdellovibrionales bacterium]|nr:two-component system response regulator [Bdellovibrionales bacterium]HCM38396.1 two-component system response regulator [Bdellovibrionales bacterium]
MVVEDEVVSAMALKMCLEAFSYTTCSIAANGDEALSIAEIERPDLVLMDINLPGSLGGVDAAREIYKRFQVSSIFLSGYPEEELGVSLKDTGYAGYLLKPFDLNVLEKMIDQALRS